MPKYLVVASYTNDGIKGVLKSGGTARTQAVKDAVEGLGGSLESFYFAFGKDDAYVTIDMPDDTSAAALALAISATGLVGIRIIVLLTPEDIDDAITKNVAYTPPGT